MGGVGVGEDSWDINTGKIYTGDKRCGIPTTVLNMVKRVQSFRDGVF